MAVSFSISDVTASSFRVSIKGTNTSTYRYIRIFAKETSSGKTVHDNGWIDSRGSILSDNVTGLSANTSYTVNVSYNSTNSANGATWVGGQTVRTSSGGGVTPPPPSGGIVNVKLGAGIASIQWACFHSNGVRVPPSGYNTATSDISRTEVGHMYVDSVALSSGYTFPWYASYGGMYTQATTNYKTTGSTSSVEAVIYPETGHTASLTLSATKVAGGRVAITLGEGIAAVNIAYRDYFGYRYPESGSKQYTSSPSFSQVEMVWVESVTFKSGYSAPWNAVYGGSYTTGTTSSKTSGDTSYVNVSVYPTSGGYATLSISGSLVPTYNIAFHPNGATGGSMSTMSNCQYGVSYRLPANQFTKKHTVTLDYSYGGKQESLSAACPFSGWSYNGQTFSDGATVSNLATSGTATLYAQWGSYSVNLPTPTRTGYVFQGWLTANGTRVYSPATGTGDQTLYAHWTEAVTAPTVSYNSHTDTTITVSLNRNGATVGSWVVEASTSSSFASTVFSKTILDTTTSSIQITGLSPNRLYYIRARHVSNNASANSNVISASTRISQFQWTSNDAANVVAGMEFAKVILATKWNDLIDRVDWCRRQKGLSNSGMSAVASGSEMTAARFNAMRNAIAAMEYSVVAAKNQNDEIKASYFANASSSLKTAINSVIVRL